MSDSQPNNPLHGIKLEQVVTQLQQYYGWDALAERVNINCFKSDPSVKSSLKFLRRSLWAREKVDELFISTFSDQSRCKSLTIAPSSVDPWANSRNKNS